MLVGEAWGGLGRGEAGRLERGGGDEGVRRRGWSVARRPLERGGGALVGEAGAWRRELMSTSS